MTIKIYTCVHDTLYLYRKANTNAQRALAGYIIKSGSTSDPVLGGSFSMLKAIEKCNENSEIYELYSLVDNAIKKKMKTIVQSALDGHYDKFAFSNKEKMDIIKALSEPI